VPLGAGDALDLLEVAHRRARQRRANPPCADHRLDLGGRSVRDDVPVCHEDDAVGIGVCFLEIVRGEEHRLPARCELAHRDPERAASLDVHRDGGLVEDEQVGIRDERDREAGPLRLASRELLCSAVGDLLDAGEPDGLLHGEGRRIERRHHLEQLAHREVAEERAGLEHRARSPGRDRVARRLAEEHRPTIVGLEQAEQHVDRRRLARAVRPEERDGLARLDREVDLANRADGAVHAVEGLRQPLKIDACVGHDAMVQLSRRPPPDRFVTTSA
jgi:hypothetical protein